MGGVLGWLRLRCLDIADDNVSVARRGFHCRNGQIGGRLEEIGRTFLSGYRAALAARQPADLAARLEAHITELQGFAYEGAAMGIALTDAITPWRPGHFAGFVAGIADRHVYMAHVGAGWALARLPAGWGRILRQLDPLLRSLAFDGYGFHQGYFAGAAGFGRLAAPRALEGYARRAVDQGLGRALWFVEGADVTGISQQVAAFPVARRADLWSGVGLAAAYAGGMSGAEMTALRERAGTFAPHLAQGAAFAAKARQRAGNEARHTDEACHMLAGCSARAAATITDEALAELPHDGSDAYEAWRQRIRAAFTSSGSADAATRDLAAAIRR
jgi:enediyne biosynthesis protein E3